MSIDDIRKFAANDPEAFKTFLYEGGWQAGDEVIILHRRSGRRDDGEVTSITPTGRINVWSVCFTGYSGQFNPDGTLRGPDHHGGTILLCKKNAERGLQPLAASFT